MVVVEYGKQFHMLRHVLWLLLLLRPASVRTTLSDSALISYHHHQRRLRVLHMAGLFWIAGATIIYGKESFQAPWMDFSGDKLEWMGQGDRHHRHPMIGWVPIPSATATDRCTYYIVGRRQCLVRLLVMMMCQEEGGEAISLIDFNWA